MPEAPEVEAAAAEGTPELPAGDGVGEGESLPSKEVNAVKR
jgi:hypothetical protein